MKFCTNINIKAFLTFWICLFLITGNSVVNGARLSGDEGVTTTSPKEDTEDQQWKTGLSGDEGATNPPAQGSKTRELTVRPEKAKKKVQGQKKVKQEEEVAEKLVENEKEGPRTGKGYVTIDFDNVDIILFIKFISELTGKNFVVDKAVRGNVTIISPSKISVEEAYKVFESVLEVHGYATVPSGDIIKIVPALHARSKSVETRIREGSITPEDKVVTQLIPLNYASPDDLKKIFAPLISKTSIIVSYLPTRMLIVTDVLSNIKRIVRIIKEIDVKGLGEEISVIPLIHATAADLAKSLTAIFTKTTARVKRGVPSGTASESRIVADERTNCLIILATEDDTERIKEMIKLLDREIPRGEGDIHVYYLKNANAEELSTVLMAIPSKESKETKKGTMPVISKDVQIVADKATNSLIIRAKKQDYLAIEDIIKKLDIPRTMVYIEALIMEVNIDKEFRLGVEWLGMEDFGYQGRKGGFFSGSGGAGDYSNIRGLTPTTSSLPSLPSGFSMGVVGEAIQIGDLIFPNLGAVLQAYQKDADVHILSTPQILTTDNEDAVITVGENVPYLTKEATGEQTYQTYEYKDVGVTLKITPQINQERFVRLKIFQEVIKLKKGAEEYRPTTLKRSAETTVIVKDENTVVIGGIIGEEIEMGNYKVPCLGDIPALRWMFKSVSNTRNKTNLFIFLTPHIVENSSEAADIYNDKKGEMDRIEEGIIKLYEKPGKKGQE